MDHPIYQHWALLWTQLACDGIVLTLMSIEVLRCSYEFPPQILFRKISKNVFTESFRNYFKIESFLLALQDTIKIYSRLVFFFLFDQFLWQTFSIVFKQCLSCYNKTKENPWSLSISTLAAVTDFFVSWDNIHLLLKTRQFLKN